MPIQTINLGSYANDGSGDDLRTAFRKVNENFALLGTDIPLAEAVNLRTLPLVVTNSNKTGSGPYLVTFNFALTTAPTTNQYYYVTGCTNPLYNGHYLCTTSGTTTITLSYPTDPGTYVNTTTTTISNSVGLINGKTNNTLNVNSIKSSDNSVNIVPNTDGTIDIKTGAGLVNDTAPRLGGDLLLNGYTIRGANGSGDIDSTVNGVRVDVLNAVVGLMLQSNLFTIDLGTVIGNYSTVNLDLGYADTPINNGLDFGQFS